MTRNATQPFDTAIIAAPGFSVGVATDGAEVQGVEFLPAQAARPGCLALTARAATQIAAWLDSPGAVFDLPLAAQGTPFQRRVWQSIAAIPLGQLLTYGEIARQIGSAPRAVGQACGSNPYPLLVPCHRVVAASGGLGGFNHQGSGYLIEVKRWLLRHEGHASR